ncbi:MAG: hypothetical protein HYS55_02665 [Candidatus Omnitrophica bacterium]|nr:hypothetical protein [Candidatus Omnitrophota bacterium]
MNQKDRRKTLFVNHTIQWHYLKIVALAMFLPTFLATACLYYLIWQTVAHELALPELIAHALFPAFHRVNQIIGFGLPIVCGLILFFALHLSHQLAGPLYRIEKELETMVETHDFTKPIRIRPRDQLHSLVEKINRTLHTATRKPH